jgi:hypothetical protein
MIRNELTKEEIKKAISSNDFLTLEQIMTDGTKKERLLLFLEVADIIGNYNHIKNILK